MIRLNVFFEVKEGVDMEQLNALVSGVSGKVIG
mgnify:CR=1 FL=1